VAAPTRPTAAAPEEVEERRPLRAVEGQVERGVRVEAGRLDEDVEQRPDLVLGQGVRVAARRDDGHDEIHRCLAAQRDVDVRGGVRRLLEQHGRPEPAEADVGGPSRGGERHRQVEHRVRALARHPRLADGYRRRARQGRLGAVTIGEQGDVAVLVVGRAGRSPELPTVDPVGERHVGVDVRPAATAGQLELQIALVRRLDQLVAGPRDVPQPRRGQIEPLDRQRPRRVVLDADEHLPALARDPRLVDVHHHAVRQSGRLDLVLAAARGQESGEEGDRREPRQPDGAADDRHEDSMADALRLQRKSAKTLAAADVGG
jgi:hypothetical protein